MGVYTRADSPYYWMHVETAPPGQRDVSTKIRIGVTATERKASRALAETLYHTRSLAASQALQGLPPAVPSAVDTFAVFAPWYDANHIAHHAGHARERRILPRLVAFFGDYPLDQITKELVIGWRTQRRAAGVMTPHFGGRVGHVPVWARVHALLTARGPMRLGDIIAALELTVSTRNAVRTFLTPRTAIYFRRAQRGVWAAVGKPKRQRAHTFRPPSARTVNREVDLLQQILSAAVEAGKIATSPIYGLDNLEVVDPIRRTMSEDEERRLLPALPADVRAIVICGTDTLARMIDILDLQWTDDHGTTLDIRDPKNGKSLTVPISTRLRAAFDALPRTDSYLFPDRRRAKTDEGRRRVVTRVIERTCQRVDVPYGRAVHGLTFHWGTRRTGATRMIRRGGEKAIGVVQQIGGWKHANVLIGIYQETVTAEMFAAVESAAPATVAPPPLMLVPRPGPAGKAGDPTTPRLRRSGNVHNSSVKP